MNNGLLKRVFDLVVAVPSVIILSPLLVLIGFLIRLKIGSPVFFRQVRPGLRGRPFTIYKFRTMTGERGKDGNLLPDSERLTRLGRFLRKTSMDELPELFNVIKGDMSIIGPRPLLMRYLPFYTVREMKRHNVRPGITGLAQVSGRNQLPWGKRLELDVKYVENMSLLLDIKILIITIFSVIKRKGVAVYSNSVETDLDVERGTNENYFPPKFE